MSTDRILAWLGVTIGILGLIPIFRDANVQMRLTYCLVLFLLLVLFAVLYRTGRGPQYSTVSMRKTLTLKTEDGSLAELVREQKIKVNYGSMTEVWCRKIVADGSITNIRVDKDIPPDEDREWLGCLLDIRKRFLRTLYRGDEECIVWSYDLINSFPTEKEFIDHDVTPGTRIVELNVELPTQRICRGAKLEEKVAGEPSKPLKDPEILNNGKLIRSVVRSPRAGATIRLSWLW